MGGILRRIEYAGSIKKVETRNSNRGTRTREILGDRVLAALGMRGKLKIGKKIGKLNYGDLVVVSWLDANSPTHNAWISETDFGADSPKMLVESLGFFYGVHKKYVRLAADRTKSSIWADNVNRTFNIPIISIVDVGKFT